MDSRTSAPEGQGSRKKAAGRAKDPAGDASAVANAGQPQEAAEPLPQPPATPQCVKPTVHGKPVEEFAALIIPAAFLISKDGGTHEITRCYFMNGQYTIAHSSARLGPFTVVGADLVEDRLDLTFSASSGTYVVSVPRSRVQSTHRV